MSAEQFDVTTDFQEDSGRRDPDAYSPLLQSYHQRLWSKRLPGGAMFMLSAERVGSVRVLRHSSVLGDFVLSSDTLANSNRGRLRTYYEQMGEESNVAWHRDGGTIGGRLIFPRNRIDGRQTINQRRGTHARIRDRFDLTLEAIRRHYAGEESPLSFTLNSYASFFALFETFAGYVDFFLLQDLVDEKGGVKFYLPFGAYESSVLPSSFEQYREFRQRQLEFVAARNERMMDALDTDLPV
ncbi:hypothetical protein GCM10009651_32630 [Microbacterium natoriense]|uniref:DUF6994 family protein n=1 Tax=Microbacterium natoriense TaxID=284570 RepID=UPI0031DFDF04